MSPQTALAQHAACIPKLASQLLPLGSARRLAAGLGGELSDGRRHTIAHAGDAVSHPVAAICTLCVCVCVCVVVVWVGGWVGGGGGGGGAMHATLGNLTKQQGSLTTEATQAGYDA